MDAVRFDRLAMALSGASTKRFVVPLLGGPGLTRLVARDAAAACLANAQRCSTGSNSCSGWCKRRRGTNTTFCRAAFNQGIGTVADNFCTLPGTSDRGPGCLCRLPVRGYSYCSAGDDREECNSDKECQQRTGSKRARCTPGGTICWSGTSGNECSLKCGSPN